MKYRKIHPQFKETFEYYSEVSPDIQEALWNYLAYGFEPGGFISSVLKNDFYSAIGSADYSWDGRSFKALTKWILNIMPKESYGSEKDINSWISKTDEERFNIMTEWELRPNEFDILAGHAVP